MATGKMNRATRNWSEMMYQRQREDALADWNRVNAYNSPQAQMDRFKAAGLNPNLVYENSATYNAAPVRSSDVQPWKPETPDVAGFSKAAIEGIGAYQDWTMQQQQLKNMEAARSNMELDGKLKAVQTSGAVLGNARSALEYQRGLRLFDTSVAQAEENLRQTQIGNDVTIRKEVRDSIIFAPTLESAFLRMANLSAQTDKTRQELSNLKREGVLQDLEINLRNKGLSYSDNVILRLLAQFADGKPLPEVIRSVWDKIKSEATPEFFKGTSGASKGFMKKFNQEVRDSMDAYYRRHGR